VFDEIEMTRKQSCIISKLHEVYAVSETKIALSPYNISCPIRPRRYRKGIGGYPYNILHLTYFIKGVKYRRVP